MDPMRLANLKSQYPFEMAQLKKDNASPAEILKVLSLMHLENQIAEAVESYCDLTEDLGSHEQLGGVLTILHVFRTGIGQLFPELSEQEITETDEQARIIACQIKKLPQA